MGSSGSGNFSDYSGTEDKGSSKPNTGGTGSDDKCLKAFTTVLEDVENCEYFQQNNDVPPLKTPISIIFKKPRLVAVDNKGTTIGLIPTSFNYVKVCLENGYKFPGAVTASVKKPILRVEVTISPFK